MNDLIKAHIRFVAIKENIQVNGAQDMPNKVMVTMFGLFAGSERDLISERTREEPVAARQRESAGTAERIARTLQARR